jgi:hypothetical protein
VSSEIRIPVPSSVGKTILVAVLDENDKPVWATRIVGGSMNLDVDREYSDIRTFDGSITTSFVSDETVEINIRGRARAS